MLSVIIITHNEEKHIARCIESVAWANQIIVLDSGSKDSTVKIARSLGAEVYETDWPGYGPQKQRALELAQHEWVLSLDADEYLDFRASELIKKTLGNTKSDAFRCPIRMIFQDKQMRFANSDNKHIRLFKREFSKFSADVVHEKVLLKQNADIAYIPAIILHESYEDWHDALQKMNQYSSLSARVKKTMRFSKYKIYSAIFGAIWMFIRNYFLKLWCLDGTHGFLLAVYQAQGSWYRHIKQMYPNVSA